MNLALACRGLRARIVLFLSGVLVLAAGAALLLVLTLLEPVAETGISTGRLVAGTLGFFAVLGAVLGWTISRLVLRPLTWVASAAQALRRGYLDACVEAPAGSAEVNLLARAFEEMSRDLKVTIHDVTTLGRAVAGAGTQIVEQGNAVAEGNARQARATARTATALDDVTTSAGQVTRHVEQVLQLSDAVNQSIREMSLSSEQMAESSDTLNDYVDKTHDSIMEITASIEQVSGSAGEMQSLSSDTAEAVKSMHTAIESVREHAEKSRSLSEASHQQAAAVGAAAVKQAMAGMDRLRDVIERAVAGIESLASRAEEVGHIATFIDDVTDQTRLLGINASIMAAQAGEQGRGFAVVAEEIKSLSVQIAGSTRDINRLLESIRDEAHTAKDIIREGSDSAAESVRLAEDVRTALDQIVEQAAETGNMLGEIATATERQAEGTSQMNDLATRVVATAKQTAAAVHGQKRFSVRIVDATQGVRALSEQVTRATREHSDNARRVALAMGELGQGLQEIAARARRQTEQAGPVRTSLQTIRDDADTNQGKTAAMMEIIRDLGDHAVRLEKELGRFRFRDEA